PYRGDGTGRPEGLALPPGRMPRRQGRRPLKRWRYVGVYGPQVLLCVGAARVADREVAIDLVLEPAGEAIEVVSRHGGSYIWTRKRPLRANGLLTIEGRSTAIDALGLLDDSAGYH